MPLDVAVHGNGVAACCCAYLLQKSGLKIAFAQGSVTAHPTVLVNSATQRLLMDVFESGENLFAGYPVIQKRIVCWGLGSTPVTLPHFGVVIPEAALINRLQSKIQLIDTAETESAKWSIFSNSRLVSGAVQRFGTRHAAAVSVQLAVAEDDRCWVESLTAGWLFLLPSGQGNGSLIAVGETPASLLAESHLVRSAIAAVNGPLVNFPSYPRILDPLCAPGWLACGTAAMSFDPICGEGAGNAVREAILACAVLRAAMQDAPSQEAMLSHYSARLRAGFHRHLQACRQFYATGGESEWWRQELRALDEGLAWTACWLTDAPKPCYRLKEFDLEPLSATQMR